MKYMLLIYTDPAVRPRDEAEGELLLKEYGAFTQGIISSGEFVAGDQVRGVEAATSVRVRDGRTSTTDGPFAETKEHLGGYYLVDVRPSRTRTDVAASTPCTRSPATNSPELMIPWVKAPYSFSRSSPSA